MSDTGEYSYVCVADPQLGYPCDCDKLFSSGIKLINQLKPEFVVVLGDMIHLEFPGKKLPPLDFCESVYLKYKKISDKIEAPIRYVAGNHDIGDYPTPETINWYEKHFGERYYSFEKTVEIKSKENEKTSAIDLFIVLESNILKRCNLNEERSKLQMYWFRNQVKEYKKYRHITVFLHHPVKLNSKKVSVMDYEYFILPKKIKDEIIEIATKTPNLNYIFSGHYHQKDYVKDEKEGMNYVVVNSIGIPMKQCLEKRTEAGIQYVRVSNDKIFTKYLTISETHENIEKIKM